jgi:hypothetical protein
MIEMAPIFFYRYEDIMESFLFLRERVLNKDANFDDLKIFAEGCTDGEVD